MGFNVLPFASRSIAGSEPLAAAGPRAAGARLGEVVDLASRREARVVRSLPLRQTPGVDDDGPQSAA
jgi:hypothetical protein